jgi:hypothetical protein
MQMRQSILKACPQLSNTSVSRTSVSSITCLVQVQERWWRWKCRKEAPSAREERRKTKETQEGKRKQLGGIQGCDSNVLVTRISYSRCVIASPRPTLFSCLQSRSRHPSCAIKKTQRQTGLKDVLHIFVRLLLVDLWRLFNSSICSTRNTEMVMLVAASLDREGVQHVHCSGVALMLHTEDQAQWTDICTGGRKRGSGREAAGHPLALAKS